MKSASKTVTFRPTEEIEILMEKWLSRHTYIDKTTLINMALSRFMSTAQVLETVGFDGRVEAKPQQVTEMLDQVMSAHRETMDDLKNR